MITSAGRAAALVVGLIFFVGCSNQPQKPEKITGTAIPAGMAPWTADGKMVINARDFSGSVNFVWSRRSSDQDALRFTGPLGIGTVELERDGDTVLWRDGATLKPLSMLDTSADVAAMLTELPIPRLGDWLTGASQPPANWRYDIVDWQNIRGWRVPQRISLDTEGLRLRIMLRNWSPQ